jgi:hypothetical protein
MNLKERGFDATYSYWGKGGVRVMVGNRRKVPE